MGLTGADYLHTPAGTRQRDLMTCVEKDYRSHYMAMDDAVWMLSTRRLAVLEAFHPARGRLLDFGCGSGRFVQQAANCGWDAWGHDLTPEWAGSLDGPWDVATFFDSLEHLSDPAAMVRQLNAATVMVSVPWCHFPRTPDWFMGWKHRKPGEHLWHWNRETLDVFFRGMGYRPVMHSNFEDDFRKGPDQLPNILTAIYRKPLETDTGTPSPLRTAGEIPAISRAALPTS